MRSTRICVELVTKRLRPHIAASEQQFDRRRRENSGAKVAGRARRRAFVPCKVDPRWVHKIPRRHGAGRKADQETQMLLSLRLAIKPEIPIEGHALWAESDESCPHADRCRGE